MRQIRFKQLIGGWYLFSQVRYGIHILKMVTYLSYLDYDKILFFVAYKNKSRSIPIVIYKASFIRFSSCGILKIAYLLFYLKYHNKVMQTDSVKQQKFNFLYFWKLKVWDQGITRVGWILTSPLLACKLLSSLCVSLSMSYTPLFARHRITSHN